MRNPKWRMLRISNFVVWRYYSSVNLAQTICGIPFRNPTVLASGIWGVTASSWKRVAEHGAGGVTTKSLWLHEHKGHPNPTIISTEYWTLNAVGVPDAGIEKAREEIHSYMQNHPVPLIANVIAESVEDYAKVAEAILALKPDFLEVNISCPNVKAGCAAFGADSATAAQVTVKVRKATSLPVWVKLTPDTADIVGIAAAVADAGADAIVLINTLKGMAIDTRTRRPVLGNVTGGLSGPAIKPIALRMVYEVAGAIQDVPLIGSGGIMTADDAIEFFLAGASAVQIGTANLINPRAPVEILNGIKAYLQKEGLTNIQELVGAIRK